MTSQEYEKTELSQIFSLADILRTRETDLPRPPEIETALQLLKKVIDPYLNQLVTDGCIILYEGSLQYNDPRNLDADLLFVFGSKEQGAKHRVTFHNIERAVQKVSGWPAMGRNKGKADPNFAIFSLPEMLASVQAFLDVIKDPEKDIVDYNISGPEWVSSLITARPLYPSQQKILESYRAAAITELVKSTQLSTEVKRILENVIEMRAMRRATKAVRA